MSRYLFWLGASAEEADPATHERSQSPLSPPIGGYPLRKPLRNMVGYEIKPDYGWLERIGIPGDPE